jgi:hypothetical protein
MTKHLIIIFAFFALYACKESQVTPGSAANPPVYKKSDLQKLRWMEGNWKSMVDGPGYYQTYYFPNDSTLEVLSYQFNGTDTSATTKSTVYWKNKHIYLGPNGEWATVLLDKKTVQFDPVRPGWNTIKWTQNNPDEWIMVQQKPEITRTIKMKRQPALGELLKQ